MWRAFRHCCGKELGPFYWLVLAAAIAVFSPSCQLLSILFRCNGFARIQKAVVDQTSSRPPNSDHDLFWCKFGFGKCFGASSLSNHWAGRHHLSYKIYFSSHITVQSRNGSLLHRIEEDDTSKTTIFLISGQLMRYPLIEPFHFSNLLQILNDHRMVNVKFFGSFSYNCKRISFNDCSQLVVVNFRWPASVLLSFKALISFAKFLESPPHCMFVSSSLRQMHCSFCKLSLLLYDPFWA